jgi:DNA repair exonuclease SbcCD ATPase subunit
MKTIVLIAEELEAFRSFVEPSSFDFPPRGLYGIRGRNADTGGSSGAGKSSINLGIAYALGYCPFPATELQSWLTDKPMSATLKLTTPDAGLVVTRGVSGLRLGMRTSEGTTELKGRAAEAELTKRLGLSPAMLSALTYRAQRSDGTFLSKTNVEIQEFLTAVLGLEVYEQAILLSAKNIKTFEDRLQQVQGKLEVLTTQLREARRQAEEAEAAYRPVDTSALEQGVADAKVEASKWEAICEGIRTRKDEYQKQFRTVLNERVSAIRDEMDVLKPRQLAANRQAAAAPGYERDLVSVAADRREMDRTVGEGRSCSTCGQLLGAEFQDAYAQELLNKRQRLDDKELAAREGLSSATTARGIAASLDEEVRQLQARITAGEAEASKEFEVNLKQLEAAAANARAGSIAVHDQLNSLQRQLADAQARNASAKSSLDLRRALVVAAEGELGGQELALGNVRVQLSEEQDFSAMVGREGFLGAIFDEVLSEVAEQANAIMAQVPNVAHVTLAFKSESVTGKGTTRRAITPVVTVGGHEANLKSGCSGGMLGAVYLAADLAVIDVVSRRLGVSPGWLVLDEVFTGLGPTETEACLEVLQEYAQGKLVLVIDHASETKGYFQQGTDLVYEGGKTKIEQGTVP